MESHLLQMRGLKRHIKLINDIAVKVASFTDAWIETYDYSVCNDPVYVASFTDAWIETGNSFKFTCISLSHLLQMRGLKH